MSVYYRVTKEVHDAVVVFEPKAVYEQVKFEGGKWVEDQDKMNKPLEICFSKGIAHAFFAISMFLEEGDVYSIYRTEEKPCVDLEEVTVGDFQAIREVRYLKSVKAIKIGTLKIQDPFCGAIRSLYDNNNFAQCQYFDCQSVLRDLNAYYGRLADEIEWEAGQRCSVL